jgi:hypothetical protein
VLTERDARDRPGIGLPGSGGSRLVLQGYTFEPLCVYHDLLDHLGCYPLSLSHHEILRFFLRSVGRVDLAFNGCAQALISAKPKYEEGSGDKQEGWVD